MFFTHCDILFKNIVENCENPRLLSFRSFRLQTQLYLKPVPSCILLKLVDRPIQFVG